MGSGEPHDDTRAIPEKTGAAAAQRHAGAGEWVR